MNQPETRIVTTEPQAVTLQQSPAEIIRFATETANQLKDVVESQGLFTNISGKKYLNAEAWETILALDGAHPIIEWTKAIMENDTVVGYWARAAVVKNGETISTGEMPCGFDDFPSRGKTGTAQHRACVSAAETWAVAKACRNKYAWVVTLAGYAPTPANEMIPDRPPQPAPRPAPPKRQAPAKAPESPAERQNEAEGTNPPGKVVALPNQVAVPKTMTGIDFVAVSRQVGWDGNIVAGYLGNASVVEWSEKNGHGSDYRPAWDACVAAWEQRSVVIQ